MRAVLMPLVVFCALAVLPSGAAAAPSEIGFSGRLSGSDGPVEGAVSLRFQLFAGAKAVWSEAQEAIATDGLVFVALGRVTPLGDALGEEGLELEITVDGEVMSPRLPLVAVPYAARAGSAEQAAFAEEAAHADDTDTVGGFPASAFAASDQSCAVGSVVNAIDAEGNVSCSEVSRAQLQGSELAFYRTHDVCNQAGYNDFATEPTCTTPLCSVNPMRYHSCTDTSCVAIVPQICDNELLGYLLAPSP